MIALENDQIFVEINPFGAELSSIIDKSTKIEYLWQGQDPWNRRAPILFPIVGRLKGDSYIWEGKTYPLGQHGFARGNMFEVVSQSNHRVTFLLSPTPETEAAFPFNFSFSITFSLINRVLSQTFEVVNLGKTEMPVSFGAHPAFNVNPLNDFYLDLHNHTEEMWSDTVVDGIRNGQMRNLVDGDRIELTKDLFDEDALIYADLKAYTTTIRKQDDSPYVSIHYPDFTHLGIWAKPGAPFVCIEPWMGVADKKEHNGELRSKEGIIMLQPEKRVERTMEISVF